MPGNYAGLHVASEHELLQLFDGLPDGVGLLEDIDAVLVLLDHAAYAVEVSVDVAEAAKAGFFGVGFHVRPLVSHTPWVGVSCVF